MSGLVALDWVFDDRYGLDYVGLRLDVATNHG